MNFTNQEQESKIMKVLGKDDKHLVVAIQESMFVFENLLNQMINLFKCSFEM